MMKEAPCGLYHEDINWDDDRCPACLKIASLRAEVERLHGCCAKFDAHIEAIERERNEALAQVAVLDKELRHEHTLHHERLISCRWQLKKIPDEARALLDRLQRAEAAVEAVKECVDHTKHTAMCACSHEQNDPSCHVGKFREALAAWEGGDIRRTL